MSPLAKRTLTLPVDFIQRPTCLARLEDLIAVTEGPVRVVVDFDAGRTTIDYPVPVHASSPPHSSPYWRWVSPTSASTPIRAR